MKRVWLLFAFVLAAAVAVYAYTVPQDSSKARYFYVFGPQGNPTLGALEEVDHEQRIFIDVPQAAPGEVILDVYDPDTGGFLDLRVSPEKEWDTVVSFAVLGAKNEVLAQQEFGADAGYDKSFFRFGPFAKEKGEPIEGGYRFQLVAKGLKGEDQNLFNVRIYPEGAESFCEKISFRLLPYEGDMMFFYPALPAQATRITVQNYDLDPDGGAGILFDPLSPQGFKISDSGTAQWAETTLDLPVADQARRLRYVIIKKTQRYANAAIRVKSADGTFLPIYFRKGKAPLRQPKVRPAPVPAKPQLDCNTFLFDATSSFDPDKQKLTYLWDFGDGQTSSEPVVTHAYQKAGEYTVTLTVQDNSGLQCDSSTTRQTVTVNTPPQAAFSGAQDICAGSAVAFDASATTDDDPANLTYTWNFGDGTSATGKQVTKTFDKGGTYRVTLTVDDGSGSRCSTSGASQTVSVNEAPVANAGRDIDLCIPAEKDFAVTLSADGSRDPDGDALTYTWDFGDGTSGTGKTVSHTYAAAGTYEARVSVNDGSGLGCAASTDTVSVRLNRQPIADAGPDVSGCTGSAVSFDGSGSRGDGLSYRWDFGDGATAEGAQVTHTYAKGGRYRVVLSVDDGKGTGCSAASDSVTALINTPPSAALSASPSTAVCVGTKVAFDASGSNDPDGNSLQYAWDFGDGTTIDAGPRVSHAYAKGGTYTVRVTVSDAQQSGCSQASAGAMVRVNTPPVADVGENLVCCLDKETVFDGSNSRDADGDTLSYAWDFGDGTTAEGARVTHAYNKIGTYKVTLRVNDQTGTPCSSSADSFVATVNAQPTPVIRIQGK